MTQFTLVETFPHSKEKVFLAFSKAENIVQWIAPIDSLQTKAEEFDFSLEGRFLIAFGSGDDVFRLAGQFLSINAYDGMSFTWIWQGNVPHAGVESHVAVSFAQVGSQTELTLTHSRLDAPGMTERHRAGWPGSFHRLTNYLKEL